MLKAKTLGEKYLSLSRRPAEQLHRIEAAPREAREMKRARGYSAAEALGAGTSKDQALIRTSNRIKTEVNTGRLESSRA